MVFREACVNFRSLHGERKTNIFINKILQGSRVEDKKIYTASGNQISEMEIPK
jgi:hypothetical protein